MILDELSIPSNQDNPIHNLSDEQCDRLESVKNSFPSFTKEGLEHTNIHEHKIEVVKGTNPIKQILFRVSCCSI